MSLLILDLNFEVWCESVDFRYFYSYISNKFVLVIEF